MRNDNIPPLPALSPDILEKLNGIAPVSRETIARLGHYGQILREEMAQQNLISVSTMDDFWNRHILDSAQLLAMADGVSSMASWLDIGSGAGLPGMIIAILTGGPVTMVEPRKLRADFLKRTAQSLGLSNCTIICGKVENLPVGVCYDIITARAVAPLSDLFVMALHVARSETVWILPKGKNATKELELARASWQGDFTVNPSMTSDDASIILARHIRRKSKGSVRR